MFLTSYESFWIYGLLLTTPPPFELVLRYSEFSPVACKNGIDDMLWPGSTMWSSKFDFAYPSFDTTVIITVPVLIGMIVLPTTLAKNAFDE